MSPIIAFGKDWLSKSLLVSTVPNTGRSQFDRSDRGLDEGVIKWSSLFSKVISMVFFYGICADFACLHGSFDR